MDQVNRNTSIKDLMNENNTNQASYKTSDTTNKTPQGYFVKTVGDTIRNSPEFNRQVALAKERLLRGEIIKSTDIDFKLVSLEPIQKELRNQGLNVVYTVPSRFEPYKQLKLLSDN